MSKKYTIDDFAGRWDEQKNLAKFFGLISDKESIEDLDLASYNLRRLPENLVGFCNLKHINLYDNWFEEIPEVLFEMERLHTLNISQNKLDFIPSKISLLQNLTELNLGDNKISRIPDEIGKLKNLKILRLYGNRITYLSPCIANLTNLEFFSIDRDLSKIPAISEVINSLPQQTRIDVSCDVGDWQVD
jgi:Leucine-rich repeat (LRR) protein